MRPHRVREHIPLVLGALTLLGILGCTGDRTTENTGDVTINLAFRPDPPKVGATVALVTLTDRDGHPIQGAALKLEGNMNHAGMTPLFASAREVQPGRYEAALEFTMAGDWFLLIDATLADGRKLHRKVDVRGVGAGIDGDHD